MADLLIPATVIGSWSFPGWYEKFVGDVRERPDLFGPVDREEAVRDAIRLAIDDQRRAGLDRITDAGAHDIDILFYGSTSPRRSQIMEKLTSRGFRTASLFGKYGPDRDAYIARARLVLNIHCFETTHLEQVRLSYLLNNKRFVVSETSDNNPYGNGVVFCDYQDIVDRCAHYLRPGMEEERTRIAEIGYEGLQRIPMTNSIINAFAKLKPYRRRAKRRSLAPD